MGTFGHLAGAHTHTDLLQQAPVSTTSSSSKGLQTGSFLHLPPQTTFQRSQQYLSSRTAICPSLRSVGLGSLSSVQLVGHLHVFLTQQSSGFTSTTTLSNRHTGSGSLGQSFLTHVHFFWSQHFPLLTVCNVIPGSSQTGSAGHFPEHTRLYLVQQKSSSLIATSPTSKLVGFSSFVQFEAGGQIHLNSLQHASGSTSFVTISSLSQVGTSMGGHSKHSHLVTLQQTPTSVTLRN